MDRETTSQDCLIKKIAARNSSVLIAHRLEMKVSIKIGSQAKGK
jgi:hypothetical protein